MPVIGEITWFGERHGAVRVKGPGHDLLVIETEWVAAAGEPAPTTEIGNPDRTFTTSADTGRLGHSPRRLVRLRGPVII